MGARARREESGRRGGAGAAGVEEHWRSAAHVSEGLGAAPHYEEVAGHGLEHVWPLNFDRHLRRRSAAAISMDFVQQWWRLAQKVLCTSVPRCPGFRPRRARLPGTPGRDSRQRQARRRAPGRCATCSVGTEGSGRWVRRDTRGSGAW